MLRRALILSVAGNSLAILPWMLWQGFPVPDSLGILAIIAVVGITPGIRATWQQGLSIAEKRILVAKFTLMMPVIALVLLAIIWTTIRFQESGQIVPDILPHWIAIVSAASALFGWFSYFHVMERKSKMRKFRFEVR